MELSPQTVKRNIQMIADLLGFSDCRVARAGRAEHADRYLEWLTEGSAGEMKWMERNVERRVDPREVLPGAQSVISLALNYYPGQQDSADNFRIARYAWNEDYHELIEEKLQDLNLAMEDMGGTQRYYVDTGPVLERDFATSSGLGWNGKSTVQIHKKFGTWFFLCELITTLPIPSDDPFGDHCGKCTRCIDHCPTKAIIAPQKMDARRCISYLTIEYHGSIPLEFRPLIGNRIYGCDVCLEVCPWNRFAQLSRETKLHAKKVIFDHTLRDFLSLTEDGFRTIFAKSPIKRIKRERFLRNVCVALGNVGDSADIPPLMDAVKKESPLVQEHAQWAIDEIQRRLAIT